MSGGRFDYKQHHIEDIAEDIERVVKTSSDEFTPETLDELREGVRVLRLAATYAHRIDWLLSGDDGEDTFHKRLKEEKEGFV